MADPTAAVPDPLRVMGAADRRGALLILALIASGIGIERFQAGGRAQAYLSGLGVDVSQWGRISRSLLEAGVITKVKRGARVYTVLRA